MPATPRFPWCSKTSAVTSELALSRLDEEPPRLRRRAGRGAAVSGGTAGVYWPIVAAGRCLAGALIAPAERVRLVPADPTAAASQLRTDLNTLLDKVTGHGGRMPGDAVEKVRRIGEVLDAILDRPTELAANPDVPHGVTRLARVDLPLSVQT